MKASRALCEARLPSALGDMARWIALRVFRSWCRRRGRWSIADGNGLSTRPFVAFLLSAARPVELQQERRSTSSSNDIEAGPSPKHLHFQNIAVCAHELRSADFLCFIAVFIFLRCFVSSCSFNSLEQRVTTQRARAPTAPRQVPRG